MFSIQLPATLVSIAVTPVSPSIAKGATQQFTATGAYSDSSTQNVTGSVTWLSQTLSPATLVSIAVTPVNPSIVKGTTQQFTATGTYSDTSTQTITTSVTWISQTLSVATFSTTTPGLASGAGAGTSQITAMLGSVTSLADVLTVTPATLVSIAVTPLSPSIAKGTTQQFTATGTYSDSSTQNITTTVTWISQMLSVATFSTTTPGLATGVGTGTSQITAMLGSVTSLADMLTVTPAALVSIAVTPMNPTILVAGTQPFTATGTYSDNSTQNITTSATWASATTGIATIGASTGLATGVSAGTSQITAMLGSIKSASDTLTVNNPAPLIESLAPSHSPAGTSFTLAVNGSSFVSSSAVSFNGKSEATTFVSATQVIAIIPATDVAMGGAVNVAVINPAPGGGTSPTSNFTIDDFSVAGPGSTVDVTPGQPTPVMITMTPTANGFTNPIQLSVSGLPAGTTGVFSQNPITPGTTTTKVTLTITAAAAMAMHPGPADNKFPTGPIGLLATIVAAGLLILRRRTQYGVLLPVRAAFILWMVVFAGLGASLSGCTAGFPMVNNATPPGNYPVVVTGVSGTEQNSGNVMLSIE